MSRTYPVIASRMGLGGVERIVNMNWEKIMPPPSGAGRYSYLTAVTEIENELVEILDVEKILNEICPVNTEVSADIANDGEIQKVGIMQSVPLYMYIHEKNNLLEPRLSKVIKEMKELGLIAQYRKVVFGF